MNFRSKLLRYYYENTALVWSLTFICALAILDFLDLGRFPWLIGKGWFTHNDIQALVALFVGAPLVLTLFEAFQANQESQTQTELQIQPYVRMAWVAGPVPNERAAQGIKSTCLKIVNEGKGVMRNINYEIWVGDERAEVRNHSIISVGGQSWIAYRDEMSKEILGNPVNQNPIQNHRIIREEKLHIKGTYENVHEDVYEFEFSSDPAQQSWFREDRAQKKIGSKLFSSKNKK